MSVFCPLKKQIACIDFLEKELRRVTICKYVSNTKVYIFVLCQKYKKVKMEEMNEISKIIIEKELNPLKVNIFNVQEDHIA